MTKKLWGGRFSKEIDKDFFKFEKSIDFDYKLAEDDIYYSLIHVSALKETGILKKKEAEKLSSALHEILRKIKKGKFEPNLNAEDIHSDIENRVEKKVGKLVLKLHSLRSRNDQIVFDEKYYCLEKAQGIRGSLLDLRESLLYLAKKNINEKFIGYTHTQRAQAILFKHYLLAFNCMFTRDSNRFKNFYANLFISIGAGALTGSSITRDNYTKAIKEFLADKDFKIKPLENSIDNVSDRDFIIEFLNILSIIQLHLSRLAEDLILYSSKEFNFVSLPEEFCTGSSLMPHKKNPDFLELVRGYTGRIYGNLMSVLTMMKGLPLAYNRDMQLDKEPLFSSVEIVEQELKIMIKFIKGIKLNKEAIKYALDDKTLYATEIAEWLVLNKKIEVPFKTAHDIAGKLTLLIEKSKGDIEKIGAEKLKRLHPALNKKIIKTIMNANYAIKSKKSIKNYKL